jgi:hypothetical protein
LPSIAGRAIDLPLPLPSSRAGSANGMDQGDRGHARALRLSAHSCTAAPRGPAGERQAGLSALSGDGPANTAQDAEAPGQSQAAGRPPTDNAFIESFNGKFRAECLNAHWFMSLDDARRKCEAWRKEYNEERPHSAIGNIAPIELVNRSAALGPP